MKKMMILIFWVLLLCSCTQYPVPLEISKISNFSTKDKISIKIGEVKVFKGLKRNPYSGLVEDYGQLCNTEFCKKIEEIYKEELQRELELHGKFMVNNENPELILNSKISFKEPGIFGGLTLWDQGELVIAVEIFYQKEKVLSFGKGCYYSIIPLETQIRRLTKYRIIPEIMDHLKKE